MKLNKCLIKTAFIVSAVFSASIAVGQSSGEPASSAPAANYAVILMVVVACLLAFVIWGLSSVLLMYARKVMEKNRDASKALPLLLLVAFSLIGHTSAQAGNGATGVQIHAGLSGVAFWILVSVIAIEMTVILVLLVMIKRFERELSPKKAAAGFFAFNNWWNKTGKKLFTRAVPIEKEADILLDHDYDGIRELDNALPPWWKYGFYITIGFAIVYLLNYEVLGYGKNPVQEYNAEMTRAKIEMEAYEAKAGNAVDENNIRMPDASGLARGKEIFTTTCWPCHGKNGEGGVGPNLTDNYWLHKGSLNDIYQSIKHGYPDKGMQAWGKSFSPKDINDLAGYIKSLKGTNPPNAKAPQGDLYAEDSTPDSTAVKN